MKTILRALLSTGLVVAVIFAEARWFGEPPVVRGDVRSIEKHLVGKLTDAANDRRLGTYALALVQGGEIVAEHGDRRLFLVASVSKAVTSWGVMKLVQNGRIGSLDEPVSRHLKRWRFPGSEQYRDRVTVRHLLSHTGGLDDAMRVVREPGTAMAYSNASYTVLQYLVEDVTGQSFLAFMKDTVLRPLGAGVRSELHGQALSAAAIAGSRRAAHERAGPGAIRDRVHRQSGAVERDQVTSLAMTAGARRQILYNRLRPASIAILAGILIIIAWRFRATGAR